MLKITITETALIFATMDEKVLQVVDSQGLEVKEVQRGFRVSGTPKKLFYLLHELARDFDIEIV